MMGFTPGELFRAAVGAVVFVAFGYVALVFAIVAFQP